MVIIGRSESFLLNSDIKTEIISEEISSKRIRNGEICPKFLSRQSEVS